MRNHHEKTRDMARSVLPSAARKPARVTRAVIHGRERARERQLLHELRCDVDAADREHLGVSARHRGDVAEMVWDRRAADKVGPLLRWAERTIERDPDLMAASSGGREAHFRVLLPAGLIGDHAILHLHRLLEGGSRRFTRSLPVTGPNPEVVRVQEVVAAGRHGELNRRIRATSFPLETEVVVRPSRRLIDAEHPHPGVLVPRKVTVVRYRRPVRFLAGAHDAEAFVGQAGPAVIAVLRAVHAETVRAACPRS